MRHVSIAKTAMAVGTVSAAWHAMWVMLVAVGWATSVPNFILGLHFLMIDFQLAPYSPFTVLSVIAITFCVGAVLRAMLAIVWNWLTFASEPEWAPGSKHTAATTN